MVGIKGAHAVAEMTVGGVAAVVHITEGPARQQRPQSPRAKHPIADAPPRAPRTHGGPRPPIPCLEEVEHESLHLVFAMVPHGYGLRAVAVEASNHAYRNSRQAISTDSPVASQRAATSKCFTYISVSREPRTPRRHASCHASTSPAQVEVAVRRPAVVAQVDKHGKQRHRGRRRR